MHKTEGPESYVPRIRYHGERIAIAGLEVSMSRRWVLGSMSMSLGGSMRPEAQYAARHVDRVPNTRESRIVFGLATALLGLVGGALSGIGLVQDRGGIWPAMGFVVCVAVVAVSGFNLVPFATSGGTTGQQGRA